MKQNLTTKFVKIFLVLAIAFAPFEILLAHGNPSSIQAERFMFSQNIDSLTASADAHHHNMANMGDHCQHGSHQKNCGNSCSSCVFCSAIIVQINIPVSNFSTSFDRILSQYADSIVTDVDINPPIYISLV